MITPKEAQKITSEEKDRIVQLEYGIDEIILKNSKNNITHHSFEVPCDLNTRGHRILDEIEKRYSSHYAVIIDCSKSPAYIFLHPKRENQ